VIFPTDDEDLFRVLKDELFSAVLGDVLDEMGFLHNFLPPSIRPLRQDAVLVGRAMTVQEADCAGPNIGNSGKKEEFGLMFAALDNLKPGEVYICTGSSPSYALWGELMSTRAKALGAAGAVLDGYHRDSAGILRLGLPVFSTGPYAQDQKMRGRVIDYRCTLEFPNAVRVEPGDLVFGDQDGVLVIPQKAEVEAIRLALEKVRGESKVRIALESGMSTQEAFARFGVM
jgi:regulator of RNase E activity RraA